MDLIFMDLIGPLPPSLRRACFALSTEDHVSRYGLCYLLKTKADTYQAVVNWLKHAQRRAGNLPTCVVTDSGGEFVNKRMTRLFKGKGIEHRMTAPYAHKTMLTVKGIAKHCKIWPSVC